MNLNTEHGAVAGISAIQSAAPVATPKQEGPPWRRTIIVVESLMAMAGLAGAIQLLAGVATPPDRQLPSGLSNWVLPGWWLLGTVALPSAVAAGLAIRGRPSTPTAVWCASALLATELVVQIPFLGLSWLQALCGAVAVGMATIAWGARQRGWQPAVAASEPTAVVPASGAAGNAYVDLYWLPLGAGGRCVRFNGCVYEALVAVHESRPVRDLYHCALEVRVDGSRYIVEMAPVWNEAAPDRGAVCEGAVGARWLGRLRWFRYEVRCWRDGHIPDVGEAVDSPQRLTEASDVARHLLAIVQSTPALVWGRDELRLGEMWNSNALIAWLLAHEELSEAVVWPPNARAPGWDAGLELARRTRKMVPALR